MGLGEALALQASDVDLQAKTIRIARAFTEDRTLDTPKSGHGRTVEMSQSLTELLARHTIQRKQDRLQYGCTDLPPWMFATKAGTPIDPANVRRSMHSILKEAKLPMHWIDLTQYRLSQTQLSPVVAKW